MTEVVDLGERLETFVSELVSEGRFKDRASVLRLGVRLLEDQERRLRELDLALDEGLADIGAGRVYSSHDVKARLEQRFWVLAGQRREVTVTFSSRALDDLCDIGDAIAAADGARAARLLV